ncbi:tRNA (guanosine(46)-N7)-methyltransferase TrmB [Olivibacter sp. XZL3]|uniref:tRNA (guanosine(46)-N7)-methyltransferase TrmB n=1 Tax=Olivibacter sp. XZL3 TaxID=1735116 RepID=UPI001064DD8A|nr:tRNA (guanosine(46)-N7)-methyltransferase TrmB [Olivibacter sp. XZL3]
MGKDKLRKFAEIATFDNVLQLEEGKVMKGKWASQHFGNNNPVVLELACGKGEYAVNMAKLFPEKNFIGVDYKGNRIWRGAKTAREELINNVAFLRIQIETLLDFFEEGEVDEIWITFPDPQPQISREKKRLTSDKFLARYRHVLKEGGCVNLKTDNDGLHAYTFGKIEELKLTLHCKTEDLYRSELVNDMLAIKTYYEKKYLADNKNINYLKFSFN